MVLLGTRRCDTAESHFILGYCCGVRKQGKNRAPEIGNKHRRQGTYDRNVDDDEEAMHRRIALHGGAGDRAISQPRRRRTLSPHRDRIKGGDRARDSARGIYSRTHPRHRKNTHPRHQEGRVFVKNTPLQLWSCARGVARETTSAGRGAMFVFNWFHFVGCGTSLTSNTKSNFVAQHRRGGDTLSPPVH